MYIFYANLCAGCSTKKAIDSFFCEALYRKSLNTICIIFRLYNPNLSQERCFKPCVYYIKFCYIKGALRKQQVIASFVEHFEENHEHLVSGCFQFYIFKLNTSCFIYQRPFTGHRIQEKLPFTSFVEFFDGKPWKH